LAGEDLVKQIMTSLKCEVCELPYEEENICILGFIGETWIIQINCRGCHSQSLVAVSVGRSDSPAAKDHPYLIDLKPNEVVEFKYIIITNDDLLDMHNYLAEFEGNISQLWEDN
jgi:hypothetical protein